MPKKGRPRLYAFAHMWPGSSLFIADQPLGSQAKPAKAARAYGRRSGQAFKATSERGGVRIWRTE